MEALLDSIVRTTDELKADFEKLNTNITSVNVDLANSGYTGNNVTTVANFSALPDVSPQLTNIQNINNNNFAEQALKVSFISKFTSERGANECMTYCIIFNVREINLVHVSPTREMNHVFFCLLRIYFINLAIG